MIAAPFPLLTIVLIAPVIGCLLLLAVPAASAATYRMIALVTAATTFVISLGLGLGFASGEPRLQWAEVHPWISNLGINYSVAVDGISLWLIILTTLITVVAIFAAPTFVEKARDFFLFMLLLETGMLGVFMAQNLVLFYVFWELMLIPAYLLVGGWGGPRRVPVAYKFVFYTLAGSLPMLIAIIALIFLRPGGPNLDMTALAGISRSLDPNIQMWLFVAFILAFAVKAPLFPFQNWQPDAYTESLLPVTIMIAAVMSKTGTYGMIRFGVQLFPEAATLASPVIIVLAIIGILYGAVAALTRQDIKRVVAYSSMSHLNFIVLGIFALNQIGMTGSVLQMICHGLSITALFLVVGMLEVRLGNRMLSNLGGLAPYLPVFSILFMIVTMTGLSLPGMGTFAGEFMILLGTWQRAPIAAVFAILGVILAAWYMLRFFQGSVHGPVREVVPVLHDVNAIEVGLLTSLAVLLIVIGVAPSILTNTIGNSLAQIFGGGPPLALR